MAEKKLKILTEYELKKKAKDHSLVFFGAGEYAEKTLNMLSKPPVAMVDNNAKKHGTEFLGAPVQPVNTLPQLFEERSDLQLIVCVQKYSEVETQLKEMNLFDPNRVFITPMAYELAVIDDIREHDATLMISNYDNDGGLYIYQIGTGETRKLATGSIRGFVKVKNRFYYVSHNGLHCLDANTFAPISNVALEDEYNFCGLVYDEEHGELLIGDTQSDKVLFLDETNLSLNRSISFSDKCSEFSKEYHHVNDLVAMGDYVLASMFSVNGWWRHGMYDGGIVEIHRKTGNVRRIPVQNCWFPHSLRLHEERFYILDSMNGALLRDLRDPIFETDGFLRGLEFNGNYCYIGQSLHRHVSRLSERKTVSADSGIHIFNTATRLRRFISMPELTNIYHIMTIDWL